MLCAAALAILLSLSGPSSAQVAIRPTRTLGNLLYAIPDGYEAIGGVNGVMMARRTEVAAGEITGLLLAPREIAVNAALAAKIRAAGRPAVAQALVIAVAGLADDPNARVSEARLANDARKDGYEAYRIVAIARGPDASETRYSAFIVAFPGQAVHLLSATGFGSQTALNAINPGFDQLLASVEFRNMGGRVPQKPAPSLPASFDKPAPRPQARNGDRCRVVQRQMCSGGYASGMGYFCNTYPQRDCD